MIIDKGGDWKFATNVDRLTMGQHFKAVYGETLAGIVTNSNGKETVNMEKLKICTGGK